MCISTMFQASITICSKVIVIPTVEAWNLAPQSKNSIRGHFFEKVCILSFSVYQNVYFYQVSCFYHNLQQSYCIDYLEAWNLAPQSKNSIRGHFFEKVCILSFSVYQNVYFYQVSCFYHNLQQSYCIDYLEAWNLAPQSKNSIKGIFSKRSVSYLFQCIKMCISTMFQASITICSKVIVIPTVEAWNLAPQSKNSIRGHFFEKVCILSFSVYQNVYFYQVSCFYHNLQQSYCIDYLEAWNLAPSLKIAFGGIF